MDDATRLHTLIEIVAPAIRGATFDGHAGRVVRLVEPDGGAGETAVRGGAPANAASGGSEPAGSLSVEIDEAALEDADAESTVVVQVAKALAEYRRTHGEYPSRVSANGVGELEIAAAAKAAPASSVANKVCVVTGGARGFGEQIARSLAEDAAAVFLADLDASGAAALAAELNEQHGREVAFAVGANVADEASVAGLIREVVGRAGGIDLFVSNAGVLRAGSVKELTYDDFRLVTNVNYAAFFLCTKHASPVMARQYAAAREAASVATATEGGSARATAGAGGGAAHARHAAGGVAHSGGEQPTADGESPGAGPAADDAYQSDIIQINSKSGLVGSNRNGAYAGSKFGGIGLVQSFALELIEDGIKVNAICPGNFFDGPLWSDPENGLFVQYLRTGKVPGAKTVADVKRAYEAKVPMGRGCRGEDVMRALRYIVGQRYETGQAVPVTGGQEMLR